MSQPVSLQRCVYPPKACDEHLLSQQMNNVAELLHPKSHQNKAMYFAFSRGHCGRTQHSTPTVTICRIAGQMFVGVEARRHTIWVDGQHNSSTMAIDLTTVRTGIPRLPVARLCFCVELAVSVISYQSYSILLFADACCGLCGYASLLLSPKHLVSPLPTPSCMTVSPPLCSACAFEDCAALSSKQAGSKVAGEGLSELVGLSCIRIDPRDRSSTGPMTHHRKRSKHAAYCPVPP